MCACEHIYVCSMYVCTYDEATVCKCNYMLYVCMYVGYICTYVHVVCTLCPYVRIRLNVYKECCVCGYGYVPMAVTMCTDLRYIYFCSYLSVLMFVYTLCMSYVRMYLCMYVLMIT
jgi:hypothetical protein